MTASASDLHAETARSLAPVRVCPSCGMAPPPNAVLCPEHGLFAVNVSALSVRDDAPLLGHILEGRYALVGLIGVGGMGTVYRAVQLRLDREVAVKVVHASLTATRESRERFVAEARALSRLRSEHTVTVHDFGVIRDGALANVAYLVMEDLRGESLAARLCAGPLSLAEAGRVLRAVGRSLAEAHAEGIVHRDVKPDNILLTRTPDGRAAVKVIDFGIARVRGSDARTRTGLVMGTPEYMAPELCTDELGPVGPGVDQYALGVVLYEMVSGRRPFHGREALTLALHHARTPPPGLPGAEDDPVLARVDSVLSRVLEKRPAARFSSVRAFVRAFEGVLEAAHGPCWDAEARLTPAPAMPRVSTARTRTVPAPVPGHRTDERHPPAPEPCPVAIELPALSGVEEADEDDTVLMVPALARTVERPVAAASAPSRGRAGEGGWLVMATTAAAVAVGTLLALL